MADVALPTDFYLGHGQATTDHETSYEQLARVDPPPPSNSETVNPASPPDLTIETWRGSRLQSVYRMTRGFTDRVLAIVLLVGFLPILVAIGALIRIESPGPALFLQQRVGREGRRFTILKFRTLGIGAPQYSIKVLDASPHITRLGRFLRRSGLDELPQLWNVVRGDMALIGPRPEQIELIDLYEPWQLQRHAVRPGITGWWQIHHRDGVPLHKNIEKDLFYIRHQSPWLDLRIIAATLKILVGGMAVFLSQSSPREVSSLADPVPIDRTQSNKSL